MAGGIIRWIEIPAIDLDRTCEFYEKVFGWRITRKEGWNHYALWDDPKKHLGGGFDTSRKPMDEVGVLIYIRVHSIEETLAKIEAFGCEIVQPKEAINEDIGWCAKFLDPAGNLFALWESVKEEALKG